MMMFELDEVAREFYSMGSFVQNAEGVDATTVLRMMQQRISDLLAKRDRDKFNSACGIFYS